MSIAERFRRNAMRAFTTRPEIRGTFGVVASTHWLASAVGMSILEKGGNAFDAAAAAGFTLQVVEPHLNGPLGEAPILVWSEANRRCEMICGQGVAPAAATIERFRELGLDLIPGTGRAWYRGFVAEATDRFCRREKVFDSSGRSHGGLLTGDDLARWEAPVEMPVTLDYRGYTVAKGGPWSQGPVLLQQLALLQGFDLGDLDPLGADFVHIIVECAKLAFAYREAWYGDPDFVDVPMAALLGDAYVDARRKLVTETASHELRPGRPNGREPRLIAQSGSHAAALAPGI